MFKKIVALLLCSFVVIMFSTTKAFASFTWFGFKKDNTEVVFKTSEHHSIHCEHDKCHKPKHKPKAKPKHKHKFKHFFHKKGPKPPEPHKKP